MTDKRKVDFLTALRNSYVVRLACEAAGIDRSTAYRWRGKDAQFKAAWDSAVQDAVDLVEDSAFRRAIDGSDRMTSLILKANRDVYRDKTTVQQDVSIVGAREVLEKRLESLLATQSDAATPDS